jgi:hypothetical protein
MTPHPIDTMPADMAEEDLALGGARTERLAAFAGRPDVRCSLVEPPPPEYTYSGRAVLRRWTG